MNSFIKKELFDGVVVYKNIFSNIDSTYNFFKNISENKSYYYLNRWETFGTPGVDVQNGVRVQFENDISNDRFDESDEFKFLSEIIYLRQITLNDYIEDYKGKNIWPKSLRKFDAYHPTWDLCGFNVIKHNGQKIDLANDDRYWLGFHLDSINSIETYGRQHVITTMIYLNDDYEGGEIRFLDNKRVISYKPAKGDIVVFLSFYPYFHSVTAPFGNDRFAIRTSYDLGLEPMYSNNKNSLFTYINKQDLNTAIQKENIIYINGKDFFND